MNDIMRAVLSSYFRDMSGRTKILLASVAAASIILLGVLVFWPRGRSAASNLPQPIAALATLSMTDANGVTWTLDPIKGQPLSLLKESGKKSGLPIVIKTNIIQIKRDAISIGLVIEGQAGEKYMGGALKGGIREPAPIYRILGENGRTLATGKFEYG